MLIWIFSFVYLLLFFVIFLLFSFGRVVVFSLFFFFFWLCCVCSMIKHRIFLVCQSPIIQILLPSVFAFPKLKSRFHTIDEIQNNKVVISNPLKDVYRVF